MSKGAFDHPHKLSVQVRTERGTACIDIGLQWLTRQERNYLFTLIKKTEEGGTVGFGVEPGEPGQSMLKITLGQSAPETPGIPLVADVTPS